MKKRIGIVGGGPSGLFVLKRLLEAGQQNIEIDIFEAKEYLGAGMPYSPEGANTEHITNVSGNEIPAMETPLTEWVSGQPEKMLQEFHLDPDEFTQYKVVPRLLFGKYLNEQFTLLQQKAIKKGIDLKVHLRSRVTDIIDDPEKNHATVILGEKETFELDSLIICTGHFWPLTHEGKVAGYFDSPYPPAKLKMRLNHKIALRGSSLTAIDAIRTLARSNGVFTRTEPHKVFYTLNEDAKQFKLVMHSRQGLLPAIRFHLDNPKLSKASLLSAEQIALHRNEHDGFLSLDFIFEKDFIESFKTKDPGFYNQVKGMKMEEFVESMMNLREKVDPFAFFKEEYAEATKSIRRKKSVYWKEMLAVLSFALNYPAKHLSAEDMQRLQKVLMPLISIVIAFVPQSSCEELIALYDAGVLELIPVGEESDVTVHPENGIIYRHLSETGEYIETAYKTFVDCTGQPHLNLKDFPFPGLITGGTVSPAKIRFRSSVVARQMLDEGNELVKPGPDNSYYLKVPGIAISDSFRAIGKNGDKNPRIHLMAVSFIGGFNPDYSGLDFCEEASKIIVKDIFNC